MQAGRIIQILQSDWFWEHAVFHRLSPFPRRNHFKGFIHKSVCCLWMSKSCDVWMYVCTTVKNNDKILVFFGGGGGGLPGELWKAVLLQGQTRLCHQNYEKKINIDNIILARLECVHAWYSNSKNLLPYIHA